MTSDTISRLLDLYIFLHSSSTTTLHFLPQLKHMQLMPKPGFNLLFRLSMGFKTVNTVYVKVNCVSCRAATTAKQPLCWKSKFQKTP